MVVVDEEIKISLLEKLIINWAAIPDAAADAYMTSQRGKYFKTFIRRIGEIWNKKVERYQKLLTIKRLHFGVGRAERVCKKTPCGYTRLLMSYFR